MTDLLEQNEQSPITSNYDSLSVRARVKRGSEKEIGLKMDDSVITFTAWQQQC